MENLKDQDFRFIERFLRSFKALGGNADGLIDYDLFKSYLIKNEIFSKSILQLINEEKCIRDNYLDYFQLCSAILVTKFSFNNLSLENGRVINTLTYTRKKNSNQSSGGNASTMASTNSTQMFMQQIGGSVFYMEEDMLSYQYCVELLEDSWIELFTKPTKPHRDLNISIEVLVFQDKGKTACICSTYMNSEGCIALRHHFKKGKYKIMPILFNWPEKISKTNEKVALSKLIGSNEEILSLQCEKTLKTIFDTVDLDRNGLLSQLEFDLFIQYTSGETAADEWSTIEDNFKVEDHQLTFEGFLELYKIMIQTDPEDLTHMLDKMGMNHLLEQQNAEPFTLFIKSESSKFLLSPLPVDSYYLAAEKSFCKMTVEQGVSKKVKNMNDLILYTMELPHQATIVIQNQSHSKVRVRLDCTNSINCRSHRGPSLHFIADILPRTTILGHHLVPIQTDKAWKVKCVEELIY